MKLAGIVICGAGGRMGRMVAEAASLAKIPILGGLENPKHHSVGSPLGVGQVVTELDFLTLPPRGVVAVEFTTPEGLTHLLPTVVRHKIGLVSGTTGISERLRRSVKLAAKRIPILRAGNFSRGIALMRKTLEMLGAIIPKDFDAEIVEIHHSKKVDSPSGTALELFESLRKGLPAALATERRWGRSRRNFGSVGIHSLRGGSIPGEHTVYFMGPSESIRVSHVAESREAFAQGAVAAADYLAGRKPGLYAVSDMYA